MLKVILLNAPKEPDKMVATAARLCYSAADVEQLLEKMTPEKVDDLLGKITKMGHFSPIEHVNFSFAVEGVSRVLTHQLVRHRIASYSQQSQRYVKAKQFQFILPETIGRRPNAKQRFLKLMENIQEFYDYAVAEGIPAEDARYGLPNAAETKIIITMNARSLLHFFALRSCNRAQWEIRAMSDEMLKICRQVAPKLFKYAGPSCVYGICGEKEMSCGNPRKELQV